MTTVPATIQERIPLPASGAPRAEASSGVTAGDIFAALKRRAVMVILLWIFFSLLASGAFFLVYFKFPTYTAEAWVSCISDQPAEAEKIVEGPRAPRPSFRPVKKLLGFDTEGKGAKHLASGVYFRHIEVEHEDEAVRDGRVYIYFWPGGQTERAAIQLQKGNVDEVADSAIITVLVSPLTGKTKVLGGALEMVRPRNEEEASEREDSG